MLLLCCFLIAQEAISRPEVLKEVCASVEHFRSFPGPVLQDRLRDLHYMNSNCMSKILLDSHLKDRRPIAVNHNSVYIFKRSSLGIGYNDVRSVSVR